MPPSSNWRNDISRACPPPRKGGQCGSCQSATLLRRGDLTGSAGPCPVPMPGHRKSGCGTHSQLAVRCPFANARSVVFCLSSSGPMGGLEGVHPPVLGFQKPRPLFRLLRSPRSLAVALPTTISRRRRTTTPLSAVHMRKEYDRAFFARCAELIGPPMSMNPEGIDWKGQSWGDLVPRLLLVASARLHRMTWRGERRGATPGATEAADFVNDAISKTIAGVRAWKPQACTLFQHLAGVILSDISHAAGSIANRSTPGGGADPDCRPSAA